MSQKFQASVQHRGDVSYVKLGGVIDEDNELGELVDRIPIGTAVIDLGDIERINSCGVRDWVNWLSKLESNGTRSVLVECSPAIVAQINLVNNFTGSGVVKSFYVPYFCPECDEEKVLLVEAADMGPPPHEPPTCRCDECDLVMDFDDMPDSYFAFLSSQRKLVEPDKINGAMLDLRRSGESEPARGRARSRASQPSLPAAPGYAAAPGPAQPAGSYPPTASASVPSLPSIQRTSTQPSAPAYRPPGNGQSSPSGRNLAAKPPSRPQLGTKPPTGPGYGSPAPASRPPGALPSGSHPSLASSSYGYAPAPAQKAAPAPMRGNAVVYALIAVLLAAIAVLVYLVATK
jgi:anti-anti-sigma regulatory factor